MFHNLFTKIIFLLCFSVIFLSPRFASGAYAHVVLAFFGSSEPETEIHYKQMENAFRKRYPEITFHTAYTSGFVVDKLNRNGQKAEKYDELIHRLGKQGVSNIIVQSMHIFPGAEFTDLYRAPFNRRMRVVIGDPLIACEGDTERVAAVIRKEDLPDTISVCAAHGNDHDPDFNKWITRFDSVWRGTNENRYLASVEGQPGTVALAKVKEVLKQRVAGGKSAQVRFIPMMLVSGDHILNDVMGVEDSWSSYLMEGSIREQIGISLAEPLGAKEEILEIFFDHFEKAKTKFDAGAGSWEERNSFLAALEKEKQAQGLIEKSAYAKWKFELPFWLKKGWSLLELFFFLSLGVLLGQFVETMGWIRYFSFLFKPLLKIGKLPEVVSGALLLSLQSGAAANSMLVGYRDKGILKNRDLYISVLSVSALSLFSHLPMFVLPLGILLGWQATVAFFSVRVAAIAVQLILVLTLGKWVIGKWVSDKTESVNVSPAPNAFVQETENKKTFRDGFRSASKSSLRTLKRILFFIIPTFAIMASLEYYGFFEMLGNRLPWLFTLWFLPPESALIIPAQASNLYNGAIAAANFVTAGYITPKQAVVILLAGSVITAPIRTFRHALPTYIANFGVKSGTILSISAQIIRTILVITGILFLIALWR